MNQFYVSFMFIGIICIIVSFIMLAIGQKRAINIDNDLNNKADELTKVINEAEQMIFEMNKFSDYIVTQIDQKASEVTESIDKMEEKIYSLNQVAAEKVEIKNIRPAKIVNGPSLDLSLKHEIIKPAQINNEVETIVKREVVNQINTKNIAKSKDNVIHLNNKHRDVLDLWEDGLSETEIARKLNMGKGEVELIIGMNRENK